MLKQRWRCASLLMLITALGVAARETPEIPELADDVSHDAIGVCDEGRVPELTASELSPDATAGLAALPSALVKTLNHRGWFGPSLYASATAGRDVLLFLSLERKWLTLNSCSYELISIVLQAASMRTDADLNVRHRDCEKP